LNESFHFLGDIKAREHETQILDQIRKLYFSPIEKEYIENLEITTKAIAEISPNMTNYLLKTWLATNATYALCFHLLFCLIVFKR
jgi:hypothetical protein